ncbi:MAG: beta-ketoacyl-[acyl-carrier-protein] synthase family protein, partial [Lentisphaerae bacterium]|nr:beta-ketoacyl-[acyl-carrier-protein] synthase family protein [Lentisphaerota bacterium]
MREKIVVTGCGLVTPLGNGLAANIVSLKQGKSGIVRMPDFEEVGLEATVAGLADREVECPLFTQKNKRFMSPNSVFAVAAAYEAMTEAGFTVESFAARNPALINGCAGSSYSTVHLNSKTFEETRRLRRVTPFAVPRVMPSSAVANISLIFGIKGESYDISAACTSSALTIIAGARLILSGEYDCVMVGGSEEVSWEQALGFNAMRALSHSYNDTPETASRPFDKSRDGFVLGEGAGMLILESESAAKKRGAKILAYLSGFATNSNASDMVVPDADSSADVMRRAVEHAGLTPADIDYINTHGTATPVGDPVEMEAIRRLFEGTKVTINSTKS